MADNVRAIDAILADGTRHRFDAVPDNLGADMPARIADLIQRLRVLGADRGRGNRRPVPEATAPRRRL